MTEDVDSESFRLRVRSAFHLTGRGTVVFGSIERGSVRVGEVLRLVRDHGGPTFTCVSIDAAPRIADWQPGRPAVVGLLLPGFVAADIQPDDLIVPA